MGYAHADGSNCAASDSLTGLHPAEIALSLDELTDDHRDELARVLGLAGAIEPSSVRDELTRRAETLNPEVAHEAARYLVSPLVPGLLAHLDASRRPVIEDLKAGTATLLDEWPPALVRLLLILTWEAAGLPLRLLGWGALSS